MPTERARLLELALENLLTRKNQIDAEIEAITRELGGQRSRRGIRIAIPGESGAPRKRSRFSKEERMRRSSRMKAYWENWRKQKKGQK